MRDNGERGERGERASSSPNSSGGEQIVPVGQAKKRERPETILTAISTIQHYYLMEQDGESIPGEFLTLEGMWDYFRLGFKTGFSEGMVLFLLFPLFEFYLIPFVLVNPQGTVLYLFKGFPFILLTFNTLLCFYISRYFIGIITRKAINNLFAGRMVGLLTKGTITWVVWYCVYGLSAYYHYVWWAAEKLGKIGISPERFYHGFYYIRPQILISANKAAILVAIAALGPYGIAWLHDWWRQHQEEKIRRILNG